MVSALLTLLFFHFQHAGSVRFKWMDSKGAIHEQDILGEGKCNEVLRSGTSIDTGLIIDKQFLPIKKVLYGPMPHENQRMKITVGPVKCTPSPTPLESNRDDTLNFEGKIEDIIDQLEQSIPCPIENSSFRLVNGRCIYFESQQMNYDTARSNCKAKIPGFEGKLFEPTNVLINEKVHEKAMEVFEDLPLHGEYKGEIWLKFGHRPWIGFNDQVLEGKFINDHTLIMFYKQRFISNDFLTSLFLKKIKQRTSLFSKN